MTKIISRWVLLAAAFVLVGCAHPISIKPGVDGIDRASDAPDRLKMKVGYFIPRASLDLEVTTPGGGGDNVRYFPYRDLQAGFQKMLSNVFDSVVTLSEMPALAQMQKDGISHVISPVVATNSGSTGVFTWPPTNFTVDLTTHVRDGSGALVASPRALGAASVGSILDMKGNFGLTGQLAMQDALQKSQVMLHEALFAKVQFAPASASASSGAARPASPVEERLRSLRELRDKDLLTQEEYEKRRQHILSTL